MALPTYSTGTASVAAGGTVVTGVGGLWSGVNAKQGDFISINNLPAVLITEVTDTTHLKITPWPGAAQSGAPYVIYQMYAGRVVGVAAAEDVGDMLERLKSQAPIYNVPTGDTAPDPSYGSDGQWAYQVSTATWWIKSGGVWVITSPPGAAPDPPANDLVYGRKKPTSGSAAWARAVAVAGDTMTGPLIVAPATGSAAVNLQAIAGQQAMLNLFDAGAVKYQVGKNNDNGFIIYDITLPGTIMSSVVGSGTATFPKAITVTAKGSKFGSAAGTAMPTGKPVVTDMNVLLYDLNATTLGNFAGFGIDGAGQLYCRTGLSDTATPARNCAWFVDTNQIMKIPTTTPSTDSTSGALVVTGGLGVGGQINAGGLVKSLLGFFSGVAPATAAQFDFSGMPVTTCANGAIVPIVPATYGASFGLLVIGEFQSFGHAAIYLFNGGGCSLVFTAAVGSPWVQGASSTMPAAGKMTVHYNTGSGAYSIFNNSGSPGSYKMLHMRIS